MARATEHHGGDCGGQPCVYSAGPRPVCPRAGIRAAEGWRRYTTTVRYATRLHSLNPHTDPSSVRGFRAVQPPICGWRRVQRVRKRTECEFGGWWMVFLCVAHTLRGRQLTRRFSFELSEVEMATLSALDGAEIKQARRR